MEEPVRVEAVPRRGLNRPEAARYVGISTSEFDRLVCAGQMPRPFRIGSRTIWDLRKLDTAFDELSGSEDGGDGSSDRGIATLPTGTIERIPAGFEELADGAAARKAARRKPTLLAMSDEYPGHPNVYTPETLAAYWKCSANLVRNLIRKGELPAFRYGKLLRVTVAAVIAYEERNTTQVT